MTAARHKIGQTSKFKGENNRNKTTMEEIIVTDRHLGLYKEEPIMLFSYGRNDTQ